MPSFVDKKKRKWVLDLDVYLVEEIHKRLAGVRIDALIGDEFAGLTKLFGDTVLFVRVLWVMVEEQAEKVGVKPEDFGRSLGGDPLEDAGTAFVQALADFSPRHLREVLKALMARGREVVSERTARVLKAIAALDPSEPDPASSTPATSAAESSASTPAPAG